MGGCSFRCFSDFLDTVLSEVGCLVLFRGGSRTNCSLEFFGRLFNRGDFLGGREGVFYRLRCVSRS